MPEIEQEHMNEGFAEGGGGRRRKKKQRRRMTPDRLRNIATWYCQRYLTSEAKLRNYLENRLFREVNETEDRDLLAQEIPAITTRLARIGLVNDREAGASRLRAALRAGYAKSAAIDKAAHASRVDRQAVEQELPRALADTIPEIVDEAFDPAEEAAVLAGLALKRARRGPYRTGRADDTTERRDVNWLRRRGFRYDDIRKAMQIDGDTD